MILSQAKKILSQGLNSQESKSIIELVTGFDQHSQILCYDKELSQNQEKALLDILEKRKQGYPLQYILGKWTFMDADFCVGQGVLIPRDDTEVVVNSVIPYLKGTKKPHIMDLCSGSGIIAITLKRMFPNAEVHCLELSQNAVKYLEKNIKNLAPNIELHQGDLEILYKDFKDGYFDLIISNPPYIKSEDISTLQLEVQNEPAMALDGGKDGLHFYRSIINLWTPKIKTGGMLAFELGEGQYHDVKDIMEDNSYTDIKAFLDLGNTQRAINGTLK